MEITFEKVSKQYKGMYALKNFTAALGEGVYGLLGENGVGKLLAIPCPIPLDKPVINPVSIYNCILKV